MTQVQKMQSKPKYFGESKRGVKSQKQMNFMKMKFFFVFNLAMKKYLWEFKGQSQAPMSLKEFQVQASYGIIIASRAHDEVKIWPCQL